MANINMSIRVSDIGPVKSLLKTLVDHIEELPEPVVKAIQEVADSASEEK